jgi:hypothetical protein
MDAETRTRCADALAGATVEQLREDAFRAGIIASNLRVQVEYIRKWTDDTPQVVIPVMLENAAMHDRLAALALAIAHASTTSDARIEQAGRAEYLILDIPMPDTHTMGYGACDLIPALAALLRGTDA